MCFLFAANAQDSKQKDFNKHEIMAGYGYFSNVDVRVKLALAFDNFTQNFTQYYEIPLDSLHRYGDFHLSYKYRVSKRILVGAAIMYAPMKTTVLNRTSLEGENKKKMGDLRYHIFTVAPEMNVLYIANPTFKMYGNFGVGFTFGMIHFKNVANETNHKWSKYFNYHIAPVCFRFGSNVGGFIELGWGYKGIVNGGVFFNF